MTTILTIIALGIWVGLGIITGIEQYRGNTITYGIFWITYGCLIVCLICNVLKSFGL